MTHDASYLQYFFIAFNKLSEKVTSRLTESISQSKSVVTGETAPASGLSKSGAETAFLYSQKLNKTEIIKKVQVQDGDWQRLRYVSCGLVNAKWRLYCWQKIISHLVVYLNISLIQIIARAWRDLSPLFQLSSITLYHLKCPFNQTIKIIFKFYILECYK